jgi:hypothetical protein
MIEENKERDESDEREREKERDSLGATKILRSRQGWSNASARWSACWWTFNDGIPSRTAAEVLPWNRQAISGSRL